MKLSISLLAVLLFSMTSCRNVDRGNFSLSIIHYSGGEGITIVYNLNKSRLQVNTNCDFQDCKEKTVYYRTFTKSESDTIYEFINSLQLDTLKSFYETTGVMDGLFTVLSFKKGMFASHSSKFHNFDTPATDSLFRFIDNLILTRRYRFYNWGQDE